MWLLSYLPQVYRDQFPNRVPRTTTVPYSGPKTTFLDFADLTGCSVPSRIFSLSLPRQTVGLPFGGGIRNAWNCTSTYTVCGWKFCEMIWNLTAVCGTETRLSAEGLFGCCDRMLRNKDLREFCLYIVRWASQRSWRKLSVKNTAHRRRLERFNNGMRLLYWH